MADLADLAGGAPLTSAGDVSLSALVVAAAEDVVLAESKANLDTYGPTDGRVGVVTTTDTAYIGDGSSWIDVAAVAMDGAVRPARYSVSNLPATGSEGSVYFDTNRGTPTWDDGSGLEWPNFVDDVKTSPTTVANTTTRTSVWKPDINADSLIEGRIYQVDLHGTFSTANTSDQFTVDVDLAGTDTGEIQNAAANATDSPWTFELTFTVRSHGTNGVLKPNARATFGEQPRTANHDEISVDTTTTTALEVFITWGAADASNSVTVEQAHLKQMG